MEKVMLDDIIKLNKFVACMREHKRVIRTHTHKEIKSYLSEISANIHLIKNFLRLKDEEWSLELACSGIEFGKNEFYKQLRASKTQYKPYYKILNELLFLREDMDKYIDEVYIGTFVDRARAKKILARINETIENAWADTDVSDLKECSRVLNDVIKSAGFDIQEI